MNPSSSHASPNVVVPVLFRPMQKATGPDTATDISDGATTDTSAGPPTSPTAGPGPRVARSHDPEAAAQELEQLLVVGFEEAAQIVQRLLVLGVGAGVALRAGKGVSIGGKPSHWSRSSATAGSSNRRSLSTTFTRPGSTASYQRETCSA